MMKSESSDDGYKLRVAVVRDVVYFLVLPIM